MMQKKRLFNLSNTLIKSINKYIDKALRLVFLFFIVFYQKAISVHTPASCRFIPTCSQYSKEAFKKYPFFKAFFLSTKRIVRCNPFNKGGYDPLK